MSFAILLVQCVLGRVLETDALPVGLEIAGQTADEECLAATATHTELKCAMVRMFGTCGSSLEEQPWAVAAMFAEADESPFERTKEKVVSSAN